MTLPEVLIAVVVLLIGLMGISQLFVVAAGSNTVANQGTAAAASAAESMERLKALSFDQLVAGGSTSSDVASYHRYDDVPGVGRIRTRWQVTQVDPQLVFLRVRAEGTGALASSRSRAEFTAFRGCTTIELGCPASAPLPPAP